MSSTGRGKERVPSDYYPSPAWVVWRLLDAHAEDLVWKGRTRVLEPTVGDGAIIRALDGWLENENPNVDWPGMIETTGVELRRDALYSETRLDHHVEGVDFRTWMPERFFDLSIGNPPFSLAEPILRHVFTMTTVAAMLLRLNFFGSDDRVPFWKEFPRPAVRVIPERVSFDGDGTDSDYVAWFIWGTELRDIDVLDTTPLAIRNAQKPTSTPVVPQLSLLDLVVD